MEYIQYLTIPVVATQPLAGEVYQTQRLTDRSGRHYVLKIGGVDQDAATFQAALLHYLAAQDLPFHIPQLLEQHTVEGPDRPVQLRLYSWLPGRLLADVRPRTANLFRSWGSSCGELAKALQDFDHPLAPATSPWDPLQFATSRDRLDYLEPNEKTLAEYFLDRLTQQDFTVLRRSINYNDAHELNLLVGSDGTVSGVIDFDDACRTATVCELAIACAYAAVDLPDPLGAMREVVAGYHAVFPLQEDELAALYDLICARLLLTVTKAAENRALRPDNDYLTISEATAWSLLTKLRSIHPHLARAHFRVAAQLPAHPNWDAYHSWCTEAAEPAAVMQFSNSRMTPLDLGVGSTTLGINRTFEDLPTFSTHVRRHLEDRDADLAIGGYGETRPVYTTDAFQSIGNDGPRWRSVHLGLDVWSRQAGHPVYCPLDGTVYHCGADPTPGGYGATLILQHSPTPSLTFFTLYGHLSGSFTEGIRAGAQVRCGQLLAYVGATDTNGGWPPHLHFQIMLDMLDQSVDFPGVAYPEERAVWLGTCPDPRTLIPQALPAESVAPPAVEQLLGRRNHVLGPSLSVAYRMPLHVLRGAGQYLYDHTGRRYLDTVNNVAHVGHEHPKVVAAAQAQSGVLNTNSRYLHPAILDLAERLSATLPPALSVVHFVNSGSEANELALRMAETVAGTRRTLAMSMGYHGNTSRTIAVSEYKFARRGGGGRPDDTHLLPLPDQLRGIGLDPTSHLPDHRTSFIHESILSCGGQLPLPPGYLRQVYAHVRRQGGICIADEVQTGLGRVGDHCWAFEGQGVVPDVVTIGKPFGNGHPLAAVVCTPEVAEAFANGMEYFNTFGGNPVSATIGLAVLNVIREEELQEHARHTGAYLTTLLRQLQQEHPIIADVRGQGLFLGVELCGADLAPATAPAGYLINRMRELGFLMSTDGPFDNVLKIKPPLCFSAQNGDFLIEYLDRVLREDGSQIH
ncbi:Acetylornithine/succinyldiaminopimelate aminotransferase [Neolewinella maritima]|uniref:Acetylornithine/succinyldiaminopimelate aminotransferase n=1 Tax=Neolewinella maritima TaxID=1383882 RepID=A0ABN8FD25_9BACT|nr:aminotransferase class III-fold pyridoxal phosphate-dependent enzyme [Neolewinella maritima]CAH1002061.1 Acetylornithine/succinyldiaminopimelate aminotransferase [Neolewinella maritima]